MRSLLQAMLIVVSMALTMTPHVWAKQIEGVTFEDAVTLGGQRLMLNGVGLGQQLTEKVVVAGLYLGSRQTTAETVLATPGPKRLELVYLRKLSSKAMSRALTKAMRESDERNELNKDTLSLVEFGQIFDSAGDRNLGDRITLDWLPGVGTEMRLNGKLLGTIKSEAIYRLLLRIHVGAKARERMREGLLGSEKN